MTLEKLLRLSLVCFALSVCGAQQPAATPAAMTNSDVIALATAGLGDEIVIAKINAAPTTAFDTSLDGLKALKAASVSIEVVKTMISPNSGRAVAAVIAAAQPDPDDPKSPHARGIYAMFDSADGQSHMIKMRVVEPTEIKMKGLLAKFAVELADQHAALQIVDPSPKFYAYAGDDTATFEAAVRRLVLVKLDIGDKRRQIVIGQYRSEAKLEDRIRQELTVAEVRDGVLMMSPAKPLVPGEYALYEAGTWQKMAAVQDGGQYFDFGLKAKP